MGLWCVVTVYLNTLTAILNIHQHCLLFELCHCEKHFMFQRKNIQGEVRASVYGLSNHKCKL